MSSITGTQVAPAVTYDPDDDQYLVVWHTWTPDVAYNVLGRRMTGSGVVTATETISIAVESGIQQRPDVAYLPAAGRYAVVWRDLAAPYRLYARLVAPDGSLDGGSFAVSTTQSGDHPRIVEDGLGGALVVWHQFSGNPTGQDVYGRWLGEDGLPGGEPFPLATGANDELYPVAAADGAGRYFLAWQDDRNDNWDIYGGLFAPLRAGFVATPTVGAAPLQVEFGDASTPAGVADEWLWAFGDGYTSTLASPVYTYTVPGSYTVTQWVTDTAMGETDVLTRTSYVVVSAGGGLMTTTVTYDYDPLYRLITATYSSGEVYTYTYDAVGNRLAMGADGEVITYTYRCDCMSS